MTIQSQQQTKADISLTEVLESPVLRNAGIRFICAMRKILGEEDEKLNEDEMDLAYDVNRLYCKLTSAERRSAHESHPHYSTGFRNPERHGLMPRPVAKPKVNYATEFTTERCKQLLLLALEKLKTEGDTHTFTAIKKEVERIHLQGDHVWAKDDLTLWGQSTKWEGKVQQMLKKLREQDIVAYRSTKSDYFIY